MNDKFLNIILPDSWVWSKSKEIGLIINGDRGKNYPSRKHYVEKGIPFITAGHLSDGKLSFNEMNYITESKFEALSSGKLLLGDIIYCLRGTLGKCAIYMVDKRAAIASSLTILRLNKSANRKFVFYYLQSPFGKELVKKYDNGTAQPNLSGESFANYIIPIPPLPEQHNIVSKIEELFSSLDKGIESLKTAQQQLKVYRQAVLKWACEGKLISFNDLTNKPLCQLAKVKGGKRLPLGQIVQDNKTKYPYIRVVDFKDYSVNLSSLKYITEAAQKKITKYVILKDEVFISIAGTIGRVGMIPEKLHGANLTENAAKITEIKEIIPAYLMYYLSSPEIQEEIATLKKATSQPKLALYRIEKIGVKYPQSIDTQNKIIQEIESRLSVCDKIEESIEQSLKQSEALRQSILKKAFEGKLVPQDPNDEPASVLLARIKAEREKDKLAKPATPVGRKSKTKRQNHE